MGPERSGTESCAVVCFSITGIRTLDYNTGDLYICHRS
jgi:hypothetical protein